MTENSQGNNTMPPDTDEMKKEGQSYVKPVSYRNLFGVFIIPCILLIISFLIAFGYFTLLYNNITQDWANHKSDIANIVFKYPNEFSEADVKSTRESDNNVSLEMSRTASNIVDAIRLQLLYSIPIALIVNVLLAHGNADGMKKTYNKPVENTNPEKYNVLTYQTQHWITSGTSVLTATSGAVPVGIGLVGAVSLLAPSLVGGFIISGLITLLGCIILGIMNHGYGAKVVIPSDTALPGNKVKVKAADAARWEGLVAMQIALLITGTSLIIFQVILF